MGLFSKYYTTKEAADYLGVSKHTLYGYTKKGYISADKHLGSNMLFEKSTLDNFVKPKTGRPSKND